MWKSSGANSSTPEDGGSNMLTPGTPSEKKEGAQNVMAVNIRNVLEAPEGILSIEGTKAHMISFIGILEKIEMKPANIVYTIRDDSGVIEVIQWVDGEYDNPMSCVGVVENTFVRVVGCIRHNNQDLHIMAFRVAPLRSANEITTHLLETIFVPLKLRQINKVTNNNQPTNRTTSAAAEGMASPLASTSSGNHMQLCNQLTKEAEPIVNQPSSITDARLNLVSNKPTNNEPANGATAVSGYMAGSLPSTSNVSNVVNNRRCKKPVKEAKPLIIAQPPPINAAPVPRLRERESRATPSRRNKTPLQVHRESQWRPIFDDLFKFTEDEWTCEMIDIEEMRQYNLKPESIFKNPSALMSFKCSMCSNRWESYNGRVAFWIRGNNRRADGRLKGGNVFIFISGQMCRKCPDHFESGHLDEDEIKRVLTQFLTKIQIKFYGRVVEFVETGPSGDWSPKSEHRKDLCEACPMGICNQ